MMARQIKNMATGEIMEVPDGTPDELVLAPFREANPRPGFGIAQQLAQSAMPLLQQAQNQPQSTLPNISAKSTLGLTPEQLQNTAGLIQQSNQSMVQQKIQQRVEMERQMEAEKDRQQQLKLTVTKFQNDEMERKHQEKLYEAKLKADEKIAQEKLTQQGQRDDKRQEGRKELINLRNENQVARDAEKAALRGTGGAGGAKAPTTKMFGDTLLQWNPETQQWEPPAIAQGTVINTKAGKPVDVVEFEKSIDLILRNVPALDKPKKLGEMIANIESDNGDPAVLPLLKRKKLAMDATAAAGTLEAPPIPGTDNGGGGLLDYAGNLVRSFLPGGSAQPAPVTPPVQQAPPAATKTPVVVQKGRDAKSGDPVTYITYSDGSEEIIGG